VCFLAQITSEASKRLLCVCEMLASGLFENVSFLWAMPNEPCSSVLVLAPLNTSHLIFSEGFQLRVYATKTDSYISRSRLSWQLPGKLFSFLLVIMTQST